MNPWGWKPPRSEGIWRHGPAWLKPFFTAAPYLTVLLLLLMFHLIGGTLTAEKGLLFDLPDAGLSEGEKTDLVALVMPMRHATHVFFDDARYLLGDGTSDRALAEHFATRAAQSTSHALLVLADRRISGGDLMKIAALARKNGMKKVLFAEKRQSMKE